MTKPTIKPTAKTDIPALQKVLDKTQLFPSEMLPDMLAAFLAGTSGDLWLTSHLDHTATGFCYCTPEDFAPGTWNMRAIAVHPNAQGHGIGAGLLQAAEHALGAREGRILIVDTSGTEAFALTRKFYGKNGYEEEARIRDFWAESDDKVTFRKAL